MIRLIGIDVDGTLIGASGKVDESIWRAAARARAAGIHLALCSGRPAFGDALTYARRLDPEGWHVFQNGASILDLAHRRSRSAPVPAASVAALIAQARAGTHILELYSDDDYVCESAAEWAKQHADLLGVPFRPRPFESLAGAVVRVQWLSTHEEAPRLARAAGAGLEIALSTSPVMADTTFVGITRAGITKGSAVRSVAAEYGIPLQDVMYVGDSDNDLSALKCVGHSVAMRNASDAVLAAAEHIVGDVEEGGLIDAFELAIASAKAESGA